MALNSEAPIIIKRVKKGGGHGHHGGAWKVAYADFVTAMMAFFLLMWLINTTSPEQKRGIADYFAPATVSQSTSGSGGILGGVAVAKNGSRSEGTTSILQQLAPETPPNAPQQPGATTQTSPGSVNADPLTKKDQAAKEEQAFESAAQAIRQAMQDMPELTELSKQIIVDKTPEGLRIQLVDQEGRSMFEPNSSKPNDRAKLLLKAVGRVIARLPNRITITGHTSASPGSRSPADWALSSARADASREIIQSAGVDPDRVAQVSGKAASDPLYPDDPTLPGNRRIAVVLLREAPVLPADSSL
jgi:chemotaxis protein MotB